MALPPWEIPNLSPWKEKGLNYIPMHAYFKQISYLKKEMTSLITPSYLPKKVCRNHAPFPAGICTECAPPSVRLNAQKWRSVDYISPQGQAIITRLIDYWQQSNIPRSGFMYGNYEPYSSIPLGIQATIKAIYEPPQKIINGEVILEADPNEDLVDQVARLLKMKKVF